MLRIAKIVVIYKNNIEENINRFPYCSEYTYCLHLLPWVAKVQPFLLFCAGVGRGESGECNPSYFSKTILRVFRRFATKFSVCYIYLFLPYPLLILKSQLSRLMTCDLIRNSMISGFTMQWHAFRCISDIRQIYNFRWSVSALADHQKLYVWFVFLAWIEGT